MAKATQGNLDWRQLKAGSRQGDGDKGMAASADTDAFTEGHVLVVGSDGGVKDGGAPPVQLKAGLIVSIAEGTPGTDKVPLNPAVTPGSITKCVVRVIASDASTGLTFNIAQNGSSIFSADITIAAGTSAGILTFDLISPSVEIAYHDVFALNITSGSASWKFTIQME